MEALKSAGPEAARDSACPTRASSSGPISRGPGGGGHQLLAPRANPCLPSPQARRTSAQSRPMSTPAEDHENLSQLTEPVFDCKTLVHFKSKRGEEASQVRERERREREEIERRERQPRC